MEGLTKEEADSRLNSEDNLVNRLKTIRDKKSNAGRKKGEPNPNGGRKPGDTNLDEFTRSLIGTASKISGPTETAKAFGVSVTTAKNLEDGVVGNETVTDENGKDQREITVDVSARDRTRRNLEDVADKGALFLIKTLKLLDERIDSVTKPRELSAIGRDVAKIVEGSMPRQELNQPPGVIFQFMVPRQKLESEFEVIDVTSKSMEK